MAARSPRTIARAHGAKVPLKPQVSAGYCTVHGRIHAAGGCNYAAVDADAERVSESGGTAPGSSARPSPFKLGGGR